MPNTDKKRLMTRLLSLTGALLLLLLLGLWVTRAFNEKIAPDKIPLSEARIGPGDTPAAVEWTEMPLVAEAVGTVRAKHSTLIASKLLERVEKVNVYAGDLVKAGDLLIELDRGELEARKAAARAGYESAKAEGMLRSREFRRVSELLDRKSASEQEFDLAKMKKSAAEANVDRALEEIQVVESSLKFTRIPAPVNGRIIERMVEPGDMAVPGKTLLTMYDPANLRLEATVRESLLPFIRLGMELDMRIDAGDCSCRGPVEEIVPQASETSRAFTVKVVLPYREGLFPGMFGRLYVPHGATHRLLVPASAVRRIGQVELVDLVRPDGTVVRQEVQTGRRFGDRLEVLSGIESPEPGAPLQRVLLH
ncbi:MAG: efflux RND transporter periplasmic adaptor subunit [Deltaproteobacteria bacterium]|nr:efflux RND transporter periplasmic adaptor subunit [Deltaproteobacteria bacterium]